MTGAEERGGSDAARPAVRLLPIAASAAGVLALGGTAAALWTRYGGDVYLAALAAPLLNCF